MEKEALKEIVVNMARENEEFGNVTPRKVCHLEGNFDFLIKKYRGNSGKFAFLRAVVVRMLALQSHTAEKVSLTL